MKSENHIEPGIIKALIWEFIWRLGSATVLVFGIVFVMALSMGGCAEPSPEPRVALKAPVMTTVSTDQLAALRAELVEAARLAEAASQSVVSLGECRDHFWRGIEQPPAAVSGWEQSEHLDYLVKLVQVRDRCEDRALFRLAGAMEL